MHAGERFDCVLQAVAHQPKGKPYREQNVEIHDLSCQANLFCHCPDWQ